MCSSWVTPWSADRQPGRALRKFVSRTERYLSLQNYRPSTASEPSGWSGPAVMKPCWWMRSGGACLWVLRTTWLPSAWTTSASEPRRCQGPLTLLNFSAASGKSLRVPIQTVQTLENPKGWATEWRNSQSKEHPESLTCVPSPQLAWPAPVEWREECNWAGKDIGVSVGYSKGSVRKRVGPPSRG